MSHPEEEPPAPDLLGMIEMEWEDFERAGYPGTAGLDPATGGAERPRLIRPTPKVVLVECMRDGLLPAGVESALFNAVCLRQWSGGWPPSRWLKLLEELEEADKLFRSPPFEAARKEVRGILRAIASCEEVLAQDGYRWNWAGKHLEHIGEANRPRRLLRDLVEALVEYRVRNLADGRTEQSAELREWLASALRHFLPEHLLDTRKDGPLWNAVKLALK